VREKSRTAGRRSLGRHNQWKKIATVNKEREPPFAVNSIKAGDDIKTLQENMGHFSAAFTLDKYGHVVDEMKKASSNRMQKLIDSMSM